MKLPYAVHGCRAVGIVAMLPASVWAQSFSESAEAAATPTGAGWVSLIPPVLAIGLAIWLRNVLVALFLAIWAGAILLADPGSGWLIRTVWGLLQTIDTIVVGELADTSHLMIVLFTLFLGSLIGVIAGCGGTSALVDSLTPFTNSRRGAQVTTWGMGLIIFFDDYANTLLLGSTMRPVTDRQHISREKLAFLVDATAAPVAGLAIVSTWVGFEVGLIGDAFETLARSRGLTLTEDAYGIFLATLPYRFYPLLLMAFVLVIAWTGRDFGPMRLAEQRALRRRHTPQPTTPADPASAGGELPGSPPVTRHSGSMWDAIVPLAVLFLLLVIGFVWTGWRGYYAEERGEAPPAPSVWQIISYAESNRVLLVSSFLASVSAIGMAMRRGRRSLGEAVDLWLEGARSMVLGVSVLVLAWAVARVCDAEHLNTAGFLVQLTTGYLSASWMPTIAFVLSAAVAFATGSSWATMGLLIPLIVPVAFGVLASGSGGEARELDPLMLAAIGSVLAGSIFGDHCSPISDTTVLSSIAADCDHLAHVATQFPYALAVGAVSIVCGTLPVGLGWGGWWLLPVGILATGALVRLLGRPPE